MRPRANPPIDARIAAALSLSALLVLYWVTATIGDGAYAVRGDAHYLYLSGRSLAFDGDLDLSNQLRQFGDRWGLGRDPALDGWRFPPREIGPALLMVPGLWLHGLLGLPERWAPTLAVSLAAASLGVTFWLSTKIARAVGLEQRPAILIGAATGLGFVVPYYAVGRAGYAHAPDAMVCAAIALALVRCRPAWQVGLLLGVGVLFRLQNFLWLVWPVAALLLAPAPERGPRVRALGVVAGLSLLGLLPQAWLEWAHPGSTNGAIRWDLGFFDLDGYLGDLLTVLVGGHGLLTVTPLAVLAIVGLWLGRGRVRIALPAAAVLLLNVFLVAAVRDPSAGWAFGARRLAGCTAIICIGLALGTRILTSTRVPLRAWWALISLLVAANLVVTALALGGSISLAP